MAGTNGKQKSVRNMVLSLGVTLLAAGVMYLFVPHDDSAPDLPRVDYRIELLTARRAASYPVAAPQGLPESWKPTSVRFQGDDFDAWHLGFHTPDGQYVQVQQSTEKPSTFIDEATQGGRETKVTQKIGDRTWTRYTGGRYDALVHQEQGATTVVAGTGSFEQLTRMAKALKAE
ncbi:DUF4245 domain-containing protein [Streptomyces sp. ISL-22]|uniref:DUF4245 domain-containing protein n=1 Tax=unclassified Streptomyces TaxID=2593676 RepID=UPI001BE65D94|nr:MULTISPECIES: DUF4245 domain-containing protein [unclassified Streptomyces]MBT2417981.1 DUF4245 domain-containing protein [Streptomyces sp. ISL-24]MBT2432344.1 DUF4245 domain-containing protein [Streptomyces sp. ISL-22]